MKTIKLKLGQKVLWYGEEPGQIVTVPTEPWLEYGVKLDSGRIIYDDGANLLTSEELDRLSAKEPILI